MKPNNIIALNILITVLLMGGFYYAINTYGTEFLTGIWDKNGVTKIINQKVIQENVSEYRKLSDMQSDATKAIATITPSVVHIVKSDDIENTLSGGIISSFQGGATAMVITSDGYLLTNKHVVSDLKAKYTAITAEGKKFIVSNIWIDPLLDLAVMKINSGSGKDATTLIPVSFVSAESTINLGQFAIVLGSSQQSTEFVQSLGSISQKQITFLSNTGDSSLVLPYYRLDATIYPGFSGGPTLDLNGNVIGITTAMENGQDRGGYSLPLTKELVQSLLLSISARGKISRNALGLSVVSLTPTMAQQRGLKKFTGRYIQKVTPASLASRLGLIKGNIITAINGKEISDDQPLARYWLGYSSGDKVELSVFSGGETQKLSVTVN